MLKVNGHHVAQAKFPVIDVHTHFRQKFHGSAEALDEWVRLMDRSRIAVCVSRDGQRGDQFDEHAKLLWTKYRDRFVIFANIDWQGAGQADDPTTWDRSWTGEYPWRATDEKLYEYACHEGNYSLGGMLRGARQKEAEDAAKKTGKQ